MVGKYKVYNYIFQPLYKYISYFFTIIFFEKEGLYLNPANIIHGIL